MIPRSPRKPKPKHNRSTSIQQPSDYESDVNQSIPAPPPSRTNAELNLSVLRRHDPSITSILSIAPYAVVYNFSPTTQQWEKSGVEGTLFVCHLASDLPGAERYSVTILNRRSLDNFVMELSEEGDVEITEEYVILKSEGDGGLQIYGLWIFSEPNSSTANTRQINAQLMKDCAIQAEASRRAALEMQRQQEHQQEVTVSNPAEEPHLESEPMDRQLSLRELFGQQREQDSGWSVRNHSPQAKQGQFVSTTDTDFFRSSARPSEQVSRQPSPPKASIGQNANVLLDLFRRAGAKT